MRFIFKRRQINSYHALIGLVLLGGIFWGVRSQWEQNEALSATYTQSSNRAYENSRKSIPPIKQQQTGAAKDTATPFEASRAGANKHKDNRRHTSHGTAHDRLFATLLLTLSSLRH
jgi:hypothetical protein